MKEFSYFSKAMGEVFESQLDSYMASIDTDIVCEHSKKNENRIRKLIKRREKPYYVLIATGVRRVACIIFVVILLSLSTLSVKAVREAVHSFITRGFSNHVDITANNDADADYPATIEEKYYLSELPEVFELVDFNETGSWVSAEYHRGNDYIFFDQVVLDHFGVSCDNEHTQSYYLEYNGQEYLVMDSDSDRRYTMFWCNDDYAFCISSNLDKESVLKLCDSTKIK